MTTSGNQQYNPNVTIMVNDILDQAGISGLGRTAASEDFNKVLRILNQMFKTWSGNNIHIWNKEEGVLYLNKYVGKYVLGRNTTDANTTNISDEIITQLNGNLASGSTSVTVDSTTGMAISDKIGIVLTDKSTFWTTISHVNSSTNLTLALATTGAATDNAVVYTYTNKIYKPVRILSARLVNGVDSLATSSKNERILAPVPYDTFMTLTTRSQNGTPYLYMYALRSTEGNFYIEARPDDTNYRVEFIYNRYIENLDTVDNDFDFPNEWQEAILYQGAWRTALRYNKMKKAQALAEIAANALELAMQADREMLPTNIYPDINSDG